MVKADAPTHHNYCFEARLLLHCPCCHKAAVTSTRDGYPVTIHHAALNQVFDAIQDILEVLTAHITYNRIGEGHSAPPATAYVRSKYSIAHRGQQLGTEEEE